jgi:hypothetical protein
MVVSRDGKSKMTNNTEENQPGRIEFLPGKAVKLPDGSTTKTTYLVKVEDPTMKRKVTAFLTAKLDRTSYGVELVGYLVPTAPADEVRTEKDAVALVNSKGMKSLYSVIYPWDRVISVRNVSYRLKQ